MFDKDKSSWGASGKKEKKEKPQHEKKEGKLLFGEGSFGGGSSFGKSSSFDGASSFGKEKKEKLKKEKKEKAIFGGNSFGDNTEKKSLFSSIKSKGFESFDKNGKPKREKKQFVGSSDTSFGGTSINGEKGGWVQQIKSWHIMLAIAGFVIVSIFIGVILINTTETGSVIGGVIDTIIKGEDVIDDEIENEGIITSIGTFAPKENKEYVLCEYTEYFSGEQTLVWKKLSEILFNCKPYYILTSDDGRVYHSYSYEYTGEITPEQAKQDLLSKVQQMFGFNDEQISHYDVRLYQPISFTRLVISSVTIADDDNVAIKYSTGTVDGEMSEEYELIGTYTKTDNEFTFTYETLPEDEDLLRVAEKLLTSAKYDCYAQYGQWVNKLTFGDSYALYLTTIEETPEA